MTTMRQSIPVTGPDDAVRVTTEELDALVALRGHRRPALRRQPSARATGTRLADAHAP